MEPPVELVRPTILNIIAIVCYCLAIIFHIIAYATVGWSTVVLDGVRWDLGLWEGCRDMNGTRHCSSDIFEHKVFQTGTSSDWHIGSRVMMTLALILLFVLEFALLGYACIQALQKHKGRLVGFVIGLSVSAAFCTFLVLIMYGSEVEKLDDGTLTGSFVVLVFSMLLEIPIPILVFFDKKKRFPSSNVFIQTGLKRKDRTDSRGSNSSAVRSKPEVDMRTNPVITIEDQASSMRRSVSSLSEAETYKKFAYGEQPAGLPINASTISIGSATSLNERSGAYINRTYQTDKSSVESAV